MAEIYRQHMARPGMPSAGDGPRTARWGAADGPRAEHERAVADEVGAVFSRLPNPDLVMYVTPHLSANGRYPVPGYDTVFPMYETVEYAMPGEVPPRYKLETSAMPIATDTAGAEK